MEDPINEIKDENEDKLALSKTKVNKIDLTSLVKNIMDSILDGLVGNADKFPVISRSNIFY